MTENQFTAGLAESQMFYALMALWFHNSGHVINCEMVDALFLTSFQMAAWQKQVDLMSIGEQITTGLKKSTKMD